MNKQILALTAMIAATTGVQAASYHYVDVDQIGGDNFVTKYNNRITGTFNIVTGDGDSNITIGYPYLDPAVTLSDIAGFTPNREGGERIENVYLSFYFRDNNDQKAEKVRINLDGNRWTPLEGALLNNQSITIIDGSVDMAIYFLQIDGILKYSIERKEGDFYFDYAVLEANTHVPDGGATAILLGLGVLAMGAVRRKLS